MEQRNSESFPLVLRLPKSILQEVDQVSTACRMTRTAWIRKSIARNLAFTRTHELPLVETPEIREVLST
jgi:hypothetical protein